MRKKDEKRFFFFYIKEIYSSMNNYNSPKRIFDLL